MSICRVVCHLSTADGHYREQNYRNNSVRRSAHNPFPKFRVLWILLQGEFLFAKTVVKNREERSRALTASARPGVDEKGIAHPTWEMSATKEAVS